MFFRINRIVFYWFVSLKNDVLENIYINISLFVKNPKKLSVPIKGIKDGKPSLGKKLSEGHFIFGGVELDFDKIGPWLIDVPSKEVEISLHGFFWLNDLASLGTFKAKKIANEWIDIWDDIYSSGKRLSWDPEITALRTQNLLYNWSFIFKNLDKRIERNLISLYRQYLYLRLIVRHVRRGFTKLRILYAIFLLAVAYNESIKYKNKISAKLCKLIFSHCDVSACITSRNPEELSICFFIINELLEKDKEKVIILSNYNKKHLIDLRFKIASVLRGLRLGNGLLTRTHGGDFGSLELIDKYLNLSGVKSKTQTKNLMGFERVVAGRLILIVDCGKPIVSFQNMKYHGSCLAFELSSGQRPIFVNCGPGGRFGKEFKRFCRATQAHNTCTLESYSQLEYKLVSRNNRWPVEITFGGPRTVKIERQKTLDATWLDLSHDSFEESHGYIHYRKLFMLNTGKVFKGTDCFEIKNSNKVDKNSIKNFYAFFQLHPDVELWDHPRLQTMVLRLRNGEHWIFEVDLGQVKVEDSIFIDTEKSRPQKASRIVIKSPDLYKKAEIKWSLRRREIVSRNTRDSMLIG